MPAFAQNVLSGDQQYDQCRDQGTGDGSPFDEGDKPFIGLSCALHIAVRSHALSLSVRFAGILLSSSLVPLKPSANKKIFAVKAVFTPLP